jgi:3-deoxy-D-manno-octulosonic-acid transferase
MLGLADDFLRPSRRAAAICMYFLYSVMTATGLILLAPYFLLRGLRRDKNLRNLPERLGLRFPPELTKTAAGSQGIIWLHAVSVGEVLAALPLAQSLKQRYPERRLIVSTTTETGQALARERMTFADAVFYFPLDLPGAMRRALRAVRPDLIVVMETEIWPNFLRAAREFGSPVAYVNGRISDRSFRRFRRWSVPSFRRRVFADGGLYLMQSQEDARRAVALGAPPERVVVTGNLKYDLSPAGGNALVSWLKSELKPSCRGPLLVAGSVVAGEEQAVLEAAALVSEKWREALLVMAPRRPERFDDAARSIEQAGCAVIRRSTLSLNGSASASVLGQGQGKRSNVLLLDSLGELAAVYRLADCVFVGGSLVSSGGHNPLEPAAFGKAPVFGPSMENFRDIAAEFLRAGAAVEARSGAELGAAWIAMLENDERRAEMGQQARDLVERHRGATAATLDQLAALLKAPQAVR